MDTSQIRNIAVIGPHGVGKTTLIEALLYDMAMIPHRGRVEDGSTTTDFDPEAATRGMTLGTGIAQGEYKNIRINLLDTPGQTDFLTDTRFALAAADAALLVVSAAKGVDANVRKMHRLAREAGLPVMIFVNAEEAEGAKDYVELLTQIREQLDTHMVPLELPIGRGKGFKGDVDLVGMRTWYFTPDTGAMTEVQELPTELEADVQRYHTELVEAVAELHDELLERYLNGEEPNPDELIKNLHDDFDAGKLVPVMFGAARSNLAIRPLLDVFVNLFPSPADRRYPDLLDEDTQEEVPLHPDADAPAALTVFKTFSDPYLGKISVFRVLRGTITPDMHLVDARTGLDERIGRLIRLVGKKTMPVDKLVAGDIGAVAKLKEAQTGDTLSASGHHQRQLRYPMPRIAPAIWSVAIAPENKQDEAKLAIALAKLKEEDPALEITIEPRTHRTVLAGQGEAHLELTLSRLQNRHNIKVKRAEPQIPYRETITGTAQGQGRHKKQTGGRGQFGDVWLKIEPLPRGAGFEFVDEVVGGAVPRNYIPAVEKGVREMLDHGLLAGYPIVDMRVTLFDGSSHSVDSSEQAFKTAAHLALKNIFASAKPVLLEPVMDVTLTIPNEAMGDAMGDLNTRRAHIEGMDETTIHAKLPLAELAGLVSNLQSYTKGQGTIESSFHAYQEVPMHLQTKLLQTLKAQEAAEV